MPRLLFLIFVLAVAGVPTAVAQYGEAACQEAFSPDKRQIWQKQTPCLEAKVRDKVEKPRASNLFRNGTGFYVGDGTFVLSAAHVVGGCQYFTVTDSLGSERSAGLVLWDARRDIAILRPVHNGIAGQPDRGGGLQLAELSGNYPLGLVQVVLMDLLGTKPSTPQTIARTASPPFAAPLGPANSIVLEGEPLELGASGSPVLDATGAVVGMVTANIDLNTGPGGVKTLTVATPATELVKSLLYAGGDNLARPPNTSVVAVSPSKSLSRNLVRIRCR